MKNSIRLPLVTTTLLAGLGVGLVPLLSRDTAAAAPDAVLLAVQAKKGTITGVVKDASGAPVGKVPVQLLAFQDVDPGQTDGGDADGLTAQPSMSNMKTIAKAVTDKDGKFTFKQKIDAGSYQIEAGNRKVAFASKPLSVKADEETKVELQLRPTGRHG